MTGVDIGTEEICIDVVVGMEQTEAVTGVGVGTGVMMGNETALYLG